MNNDYTLSNIENFVTSLDTSIKKSSYHQMDSSIVLQQVLDRLGEDVEIKTSLFWRGLTPYQLLIVTILLTQSSESAVRPVAKELFLVCPTPEKMIAMSRRELELIIQACGFYRQKAKYIQETSRILLEKYNGALPQSLLELTQLPGVARKTANLFLAQAYNLADGIVVDTHVHRVANRLGVSEGKSAAKVEHDLLLVADPTDRIRLSRLFMRHGQKVCYIHEPKCKSCVLNQVCQFNDSQTD